MQNKITSFVVVAFALVAASFTTINAQVPTGGFQAGDLYEMTASASDSGVNFGGIIHIDIVTGAPNIIKKFGTGSASTSNIAYDAFRDRIAFSYYTGANPSPIGLTLMDAAGSESLVTMGYLPFKVTAGSNGNIYIIQNLGGGPKPYVLIISTRATLFIRSWTIPLIHNSE